MKERRGEGGKVRARAGAGKGETLSLWWVTQPSNTTGLILILILILFFA